MADTVCPVPPQMPTITDSEPQSVLKWYISGVSPPNPTDEALMSAYRNGDPSAFRALFERWAPSVGRLMRRAVREEDARDLVQQTFLQLHRSRHDFDRRARLRPWLFTIALNLRRDYVRRRGRQPVEVPFDGAKAVSPHPVERLASAQQTRMALEVVTPRQREIVELHFFNGLTFPELAQVLGISTSAAKVAAHRAYKRMRSYLQEIT